MWKEPAAQSLYNQVINFATATQFAGFIKYSSETRATEAKSELRPKIDAEYGLAVYEENLYVEANGEIGHGLAPLDVTDFLEAIRHTLPESAEFDVVGSDNKSYLIKLENGLWTLSWRKPVHSEVLEEVV